MDEQQYQAFVENLYYEYLQDRFVGLDRRLALAAPEAGSAVSGLTSALRRIRLLSRPSSPGPSTVVMGPALLDVITDMEPGVRFNNRLLVDTGVADTIEDYFTEIVDGMEAEHFPEIDVDLLREAGSTDARREIVALVYIVKARKQRIAAGPSGMHFAERLREVESILAQRRAEATGPTPAPPRIERPGQTWKGLGEICKGAILTLGDVGLAAGLFSVAPVVAPITAVGAVGSTATGIGTIFEGISTLKGE